MPETQRTENLGREFKEILGMKKYYPGTELTDFCNVGDHIEILQVMYDRNIAMLVDDGHNPCTIDKVCDTYVYLRQEGIPGRLSIGLSSFYWRKIEKKS